MNARRREYSFAFLLSLTPMLATACTPAVSAAIDSADQIVRTGPTWSARLRFKDGNCTGTEGRAPSCSFFFEYTATRSSLGEGAVNDPPSATNEFDTRVQTYPADAEALGHQIVTDLAPSTTYYFRACGKETAATGDYACTAVSELTTGRGIKVGVIGTGQSLSVGAEGQPVSTTSPGSPNRKLVDTTGRYDDASQGWELATLVEPMRGVIEGVPRGWYPSNIEGETPHTGMGDQLTRINGAYASWHSAVGLSATPMNGIKKGTGSYLAALRETRAFRTIALAEGDDYEVGGVVLTHGESDAMNAAYATQLKQMHDDYNVDLKAITGQAASIPLFITQQNGFPGTLDNPANTLAISANLQWTASMSHPGQIILVGPKYQYQYALGNALAWVHLDGPSYRRLGEKNAQVFDIVYRQQKTWKPLQPRTLTRDGTRVTAVFHVPSGRLNWDTFLPSPFEAQDNPKRPYWRGAHGFEAEASGVPVKIVGVQIAGDDTVTLDLESVPAGPLRIRYAMTQHYPWPAGTHETSTPGNVKAHVGRVGHLRDSDPFVGMDQEQIDVICSGNVLTAPEKAFASRTFRDLVSGGGLASPETVVVSTDFSQTAELSRACPIQGPQTLTFRHDHRNYAVAFDVAVPYPEP